MSEELQIVIVTEAAHRERRFKATTWETDDHGALWVREETDGNGVATYAAGQWAAVREDGATDEAQAQALGVARRALGEICRISDPNVAIKLAQDALGELFDLGYE